MSAFGQPLGFGKRPQKADMTRLYDVCIIGSGAAGSIVADSLAEAGKDVLVLERGPYVDASTNYDNIVMSADTALGRTESGTWAPIAYPWSTCNVGGGTRFYGGASFRCREVDFEAERFARTQGMSVNWPFPYEVLEPHYRAVEERIGISGAPDSDPTCPAGDYSHYQAPLERSEGGQLAAHAASELGLQPFPTPLSVLTADLNGRSACTSETPCIEFVCPSGAKGDSSTVYLDPLLKASKVSLFAGVAAARLIRSHGRSFDEVEAVDVVSGERLKFRARVFVLCANAIQSAALLLRSADEKEPSGLGNYHDLVGRGLCFKANAHVVGFHADRPGGKELRAGPFSTVSLTDYYSDSSCPSGMGGLIYEGGYGFRHAKRADECTVRLEVLIADQPTLENRVVLSSQRDSLGLPRLALVYNLHPLDKARLEWMLDRAEAIVRGSGCSPVWREYEAFHLGSCHLHGTCRASVDPAKGVVAPDGRVHSTDNVFVADGGFMPFPGAVNPTLSIQAIAHKVAQDIMAGGLCQ